MRNTKAIGKYDRKIIFQEEVTTPNSFNEDEVTGWRNVATIWANVEDEYGAANKEYFVADQLTAKRTLKFTVRYREDIDEKMRIEYDDDYYSIQSISKPDRKRTLIIKGVLLDDEE